MTLFAFAQLEFSHAIGPPAGRYVVGAPAGDTRASAAAGARAWPPPLPAEATADVLVVAKLGAAPARARLLRRTQPALDGEPRDVVLITATFVRSRHALDDAAARETVAGLRRSDADREALIAEALEVVNLAIRAHRAVAGDPYLAEVTRRDPRVVRVGVGSGELLSEGRWSDALVAPPPRDGRLKAPTLTEYVADVLGGRLKLAECEELAVRALADVEQGRHRAGALQLRAAADLAGAEDPPVRTDLAAVQRCAEAALAGALDAEQQAELRALTVGLLDALDGARRSRADARPREEGP